MKQQQLRSPGPPTPQNPFSCSSSRAWRNTTGVMNMASACVEGGAGGVTRAVHIPPRHGILKMPRMSLDLLFRGDAPDTIRGERVVSETRARERHEEDKRKAEERRAQEEEKRAREEMERRIVAEKNKRAVAETRKHERPIGVERPKKRIKSVSFKTSGMEDDQALPRSDLASSEVVDGSGDASSESALRLAISAIGSTALLGAVAGLNGMDKPRVDFNGPEEPAHEAQSEADHSTSAGLSVRNAVAPGLTESLPKVASSKPTQPLMRPRIDTTTVSRPLQHGSSKRLDTPGSISATSSASGPPRPKSACYVPRQRNGSAIPTPTSAVPVPTTQPERVAPRGPLGPTSVRVNEGLGMMNMRDRDAQSTTSTSSSKSANPFVFISARSGPATLHILPDVEDAELWKTRILEKSGLLCEFTEARHIIFPRILRQTHWEIFRPLDPLVNERSKKLCFRTDWIEASLRRGKMVGIDDYRLTRRHFLDDAARIEAEKAARRRRRSATHTPIDSSRLPIPPADSATPPPVSVPPDGTALDITLPVAWNSPARDPRAKRKAIMEASRTAPAPSILTNPVNPVPPVESGQSVVPLITHRPPNPRPHLSSPKAVTTTFAQSSTPGQDVLTVPVHSQRQIKSSSPISPPRYTTSLPIVQNGPTPISPTVNSATLAEPELEDNDAETVMDQSEPDLFRELFGTDPPKSQAESQIPSQTDNDTPSDPNTPLQDDEMMVEADFGDFDFGPASPVMLAETTKDQEDSSPTPPRNLKTPAEDAVDHRSPTPRPGPPQVPPTAMELRAEIDVAPIDISSDSDDDFFEILDAPPAAPKLQANPKAIPVVTVSKHASPSVSIARNTVPPPTTPKPKAPPPVVPPTIRPRSPATKQGAATSAVRRAKPTVSTSTKSATSTPRPSSHSTAPDPQSATPSAPADPVTPPQPSRSTAIPGIPQRPSRATDSSPRHGELVGGARVAPKPPQVLDMRQLS